MLFSIFDVLRIFETLQIFFYKFLLKREKSKADVQSRIFFEAQKYDFVLKRGLIFFQMVILARLFRRSPTLWKSKLKITTLFRYVQFNVEIHNIASTLFGVANFNIDLHNFISTLIWRCVVLRPHIQPKNNVELTLKCLLGGATSDLSPLTF